MREMQKSLCGTFDVFKKKKKKKKNIKKKLKKKKKKKKKNAIFHKIYKNREMRTINY